MQIYVYGAVIVLYLLLLLLAARSRRRAAEEKQGLFDAAAALLYRLYEKGRRHRMPDLLQQEQVRRDLAALHPGPDLKKREEQCHAGRLKLLLCVILAGDLLAAASYAAAGLEARMDRSGNVVREEVGGEDVQMSLTARFPEAEEDGFPEKERYSVTLHAVRLAEEETDRLADALSRELPSMILSQNRDTRHVCGPLSLIAAAEGYPFSIAWESSSYALIDSDGTVNARALAQGQQEEVTLTAVMTYDDGTAVGRRYTAQISVTVIPAPAAPEDAFKREVGQALEASEQEDLTGTAFALPQKVRGVTVDWTENPPDSGTGIFVTAVLAGILTALVSAARLHEKMLARERQIRLAYPEIVSKMVLYLGAGVSVRGCFEQLGESYQALRRRGGQPNGAYEEILMVCRELGSGVSEGEAYSHFGRRCRSRQYTRFCTLLLQNLRKGNRSLLSALQAEADAAVMERRNTAREISEEAETKLLFPMGMMLTITMVIIIIPAYYTFGM